jgi:hypothetical protein
MYMVVYISSALELFPDQELEELLKKARSKNRSLNITGMLLYKGGNFMQLLEGPKEAVLPLVETIERDPRHHGFQRLLQQEKDEREFSEWQMGFKKLDGNSGAALPGQSDFLKTPFNDEEYKSTPSKALKLLLSFKKTMG